MKCISFVLPMKNEEKYIGRCIDSINDLIVEPDNKIEVIVVDHCSNDRSAEIAREKGAKVIKKVGGTISSVRNFGAKMAIGHYLAFIDSDCELPKEWLKIGLNALLKTKVAAVGSGYVGEDRNIIEKGWLFERDYNTKINFIPSGNFLIRKNVFNEIGGFDDKLKTCEDSDICKRVQKRGYVIYSLSGMKSRHLDAPKNICQFYKKELWYGTSQRQVVLKNMGDKVFWATLSFIATLALSLVFLLININISLLLILCNFSVILLSSIYWVARSKKTKYFAHNMLLYFIFYLARARALLTIRG